MTNYNEAINGDLSNSAAAPTSITLSPGDNVISGTTVGGGNPPADRDFFTFVVPAGATVSAIVLQSYGGGAANSFFAVTPGGSFPSLTNPITFEVSKLINPSDIGQDLLEPTVAVPAGPIGGGELGTGTYSVWYQETGVNTTYAFNVVLNAPPGTTPPGTTPPPGTPAIDSGKTLTGTPVSDVLVGGTENDSLFGKGGRDRLTGGGGDDKLTGGSGKDRFIFDVNSPFDRAKMGVDVITDFKHGKDKIVLDRTTFTKLGKDISFASVKSEAKAATSKALITYVRSSGKLYYNENGSAAGFGKGDLFATCSNFSSAKADLSRSDFVISS